MDRFWRYKFDHILFWLATVGFHMFTKVSVIDGAGFGQFALEVIVRNTLLALLIYANLFFLIPKYAQQKRIIAYISLLVVTMGLYVAVKNAHDVYLNGHILGNESQLSFFYNSFYNFSISIFRISSRWKYHALLKCSATLNAR